MVKRFLVLLSVCLIVSFNLVANTVPPATDTGTTPGTGEGAGSTDDKNDLVDMAHSFSLYFTKPPKNIFYFSDPNAPTTEYTAPELVGIQFPLVQNTSDAKKVGYPSRAFIGIYYNMESICTLDVYFNSSANHDDKEYRLRPKDKTQEGLNYAIGFDVDKTNASKALDDYLKTNTFFGNVKLTDADKPVLTLYAHKAGTNVTGQSSNNKIYLNEANEGSYVFAMEIRGRKRPSGKPGYIGYTAGQYTGYVTLHLTIG